MCTSDYRKFDAYCGAEVKLAIRDYFNQPKGR